MNTPPATPRVAFVCDTCQRLVLPIMGCEHMTLPDGTVWAGHARASCLPAAGRFRSWQDTPKPAETDEQRAARWKREHEGRPALPLTRAHDSFTHRAQDRRCESTPTPTRTFADETAQIAVERDAREALRRAVDATLVGSVARHEPEVVRESAAPFVRAMLKDMEKGLAMARLMGGDAAVNKRMARSFAVWHDKQGCFIGCVMTGRDRRVAAWLADTGEFEWVTSRRQSERIMHRIVKAGASVVTRMVRPDDWTYDNVFGGVGGGFLHAGTEPVA